MGKLANLTKGLIRENPVLVSTLGMGPTLAVTTQASNAVGMGIATTFVLLGSNVAVSLLRKTIPEKVRIPCYIVLISSMVTFTQMIVEAYAYPLYLALGIYLPLITVNCIVFARSEVFASKNTVVDSALDALGMGMGFTIAMLIISSVREILGSGTFFGFALPVLYNNTISVLNMAPGGFIVFAMVVALVNKISKGRAAQKALSGCEACPSAAVCGKRGAA